MFGAGICRAATSPDCDKFSRAEVQNGYFHFAYGSWSEEVPNSNGLYKYGRCIKYLGGEWFDANWSAAQLVGRVSKWSPVLLSEYYFPTDNSSFIQGELKYGEKVPFENQMQAGFWQNSAQQQASNPQVAGSNEVASKVQSWELTERVSEMAGNPVLPSAVRSLTSHAVVGIPIKGGALSANVSFVSKIRSASDFEYVVSVELRRGSAAGVGDMIDLVPRSQYLRGLFKEGNFVLPPGSKSGQWRRSFSSFDVASNQSTASIDWIDVQFEDRVVASFPVTFYGPLPARVLLK